MTESDVLSLLESHGAILRDGHFVYTSGRHGPTYVNKDAIYPHPDALSDLAIRLARACHGYGVEVVAAPAGGAAILAHLTARWLAPLTRGCPDILAVFAERDSGGFAFRRGYDRLLTGRRVLVVEDVLTTGGTMRSVIAAVRSAGGAVAGAAAVVNRGGVTAEDVGSPAGLVSLAALDLESYPADDCPLCRAAVPIDRGVGKGPTPGELARDRRDIEDRP